MKVRETVEEAVREIMENNNLAERPVEDSSELVKDLGFKSLDVAELVAVLEIELDVDPFSDGVSLMEVRTCGDFCAVYEKAVQQKG